MLDSKPLFMQMKRVHTECTNHFHSSGQQFNRDLFICDAHTFSFIFICSNGHCLLLFQFFFLTVRFLSSFSLCLRNHLVSFPPCSRSLPIASSNLPVSFSPLLFLFAVSVLTPLLPSYLLRSPSLLTAPRISPSLAPSLLLCFFFPFLTSSLPDFILSPASLTTPVANFSITFYKPSFTLIRNVTAKMCLFFTAIRLIFVVVYYC